MGWLRWGPREALPYDARFDHRFDESARAEAYGPAYPSGWYHLLDSAEVPKGTVRPVDALGRHLAVFRDEAGGVHVLDAHCPHQGASLAHGRVSGEHLTCPFHAWAFDGDGALAGIPGLDRCPRTGVASHPVAERHGMIWMYHDVSGARVEPPYAAAEVGPIVDRAMTYRGRHDAGEVRMHVAEVIENSVDFQHFAVVHDGLTVPWTTWTIPGGGLDHTPDWYVDEEHAHIAYFEDDSVVTWRGQTMEGSRSLARVTMFGPAGVVWFHFQIPTLGEVVLFQTHLPLSPTRQRVRFRWFADPAVASPWAWITVGQWVAQWKADLRIWQNKVYQPRPVLVPIDGPVHRMRRWYKQFTVSDAPRRVADAR